MLKRSFLFPCLFAFASLASIEYQPALEKKYREKIACELLIHHYTQAVQTASEAVKQLPMSQSLREQYIQALSKVGDERRLLQSWQKYARDFPEAKYSDRVLEPMSWGVIQKAQLSENMATKFTGLIAASMQNDSYSVETLIETLKDSNSFLREISLQFCLNFGDEVLKKEILRMLNEETVYEVRKKVIEVAQRLRIEEARPILESLLDQDKISYEEKNLIASALVQFYDQVSLDDLKKLAQSPIVGHRFLACALFANFDLKEHAPLLVPLIYDTNRSVRLLALSSLGGLKLSHIEDKSLDEVLSPALEDPIPQVAMLASWALLKEKPALAKTHLRHYLLHSDQAVRLQAAALVGYSLPLCEDLARDFFTVHPDVYVRANLSFYLASHRLEIVKACDQIFSLFSSHEPYFFKESLPFQLNMLVPSHLLFEDRSPLAYYSVSSSYHQMAQLQLLNLLATLKDPRAKEAMSSFLERHHSDVATLNLRSVLQFDDHQALELMREFLNHTDQHKKVEAAIVLALFKKDSEALKVLEQVFNEVSRDLKQIILMAMGEIASKDSIPFLTDHLYEASQSLRVQSAAALIRCLRN